MELNAEQVKEWLEIFAEDTPYPNQSQALLDAIAFITLQEQRIKELTEENAMLLEDNRKTSVKLLETERKVALLTVENEAWQKQLISTEEKSGKAYYELACEVEDLRAANERLRNRNITLEQKLMILDREEVPVLKVQVKGE